MPFTYPYDIIAAETKRGTDFSRIRKFGYNPDVDTAGEDIWDGGGTYIWEPAAGGEQLTVNSASTNDVSGDTGARSVKLFGLSTSWLEQTETVTLTSSGTTTTNTYIRAYRMYVTQAGTEGTNVGAITADTSTAGTMAQISTGPAVGYGQTLMACYTAPADYSYAALTAWDINAASVNAAVEVKLMYRPNADTTSGAWLTKDLEIVKADENPQFDHSFEYPDIIQPKTDIRIFAVPGANNVAISASFELYNVYDRPGARVTDPRSMHGSRR